MYEKHLKQVHLSRLSPVMWAYNKGYPRKTLGVPIEPAHGMGGCGCGCGAQAPYADTTGVRPGGNPMWNDLYRIGVVGKLSRVAPFGPSAFTNCTNCGVGTDDGSGEAMSGLWPFFVAIGGFALLTFLGTRRRYQ
ncbi:MAG: hypothetical protein ACYS7Y_10615 [Planctomycetota bacterium]|jgi:hypothetical protein